MNSLNGTGPTTTPMASTPTGSLQSYIVFREYFNAQSLPNQFAEVSAVAWQRRHFSFSRGWIITIL